MCTITVIFWGRWGCWVFPLFTYKGNGRHWKLQMTFAGFRNVLSSHTVLRSLFKTKRGNQRTGQPNKISRGPLMRLLAVLTCCPPSTSAWRKSVICSHLVHGITRYHPGKARSREVEVPLTQSRPWHLRGELLHTGDFHTKWNMWSQNKTKGTRKSWWWL